MKLLTKGDVAEMLGCAVRKVHDLPIPIVRVGRHRRYDPKDVAAYAKRLAALDQLTPLGRLIAEEAYWHRTEHSRVYFIASDTHVKIGVAVRVEGRIDALQCGSPFPLYLLGQMPGSYQLEKTLHRKLPRHHERGEWFVRSPELDTAIIEGCRHAS